MEYAEVIKPYYETELGKLYHGDCLEAMKAMPDKAFELAIVDPPYGIGDRLCDGAGKLNNRPHIQMYRTGNRWDIKPPQEYFELLFRVSVNQIICGANYFELPSTRGIICWDKKQGLPTFSEWEYIWTSFDKTAKIFSQVSTDNKRIHPTQKPVKLYEWLLKNYAKPGDRILDTHLGSGSSAIAAYNMGYDFTGYEIDKDYYEAAVKRLEDYKRQGLLFTPKELCL